jgi:hypothetical protein
MTAKTNSAGTLAPSFTIGLNGTGTLQHGGLNPTQGTEIDQVSVWNLSLTLTTAWQDTTINSTDLATGTYLVQVLVSNFSQGGGHTSEYYSGVMSWYSQDTNEATSDEITLHRAGVRNSEQAVFLRVQRTLSANIDDMKLQISSTNNDSGASSVTLKFRRMI